MLQGADRSVGEWRDRLFDGRRVLEGGPNYQTLIWMAIAWWEMGTTGGVPFLELFPYRIKAGSGRANALSDFWNGLADSWGWGVDLVIR